MRYLLHRGLRTLHGEEAAGPYDYLGFPGERAAQTRRLRERLDARIDATRHPELPLTADGRLREDVLDALLKTRRDPDLVINE